MAFPFARWVVRVQLMSDSGRTTTKTFVSTVATADYAQVSADALVAATRLAAVSDALVTGYTVSAEHPTDALLTPPAGVFTNVVGNLSVADSVTTTKTHRVTVPAIKDSLVKPVSNELDTTDADLLSFVALYADSIGFFSISDGEFVVSPVLSSSIRSAKRVITGTRNP